MIKNGTVLKKGLYCLLQITNYYKLYKLFPKTIQVWTCLGPVVWRVGTEDASFAKKQRLESGYRQPLFNRTVHQYNILLNRSVTIHSFYTPPILIVGYGDLAKQTKVNLDTWDTVNRILSWNNKLQITNQSTYFKDIAEGRFSLT